MSTTSLMGGRKGGQLSVFPNGPRLRELRLATGKRGKQVEIEAGLSAGQLTRYERGKPNGIKGLIVLASYYNVPAHEVLSPESHAVLDDLFADIAIVRGKLSIKKNGK